MDNKRALTELIGSLAVVYFAVSGGAMATGLVLAIFMIAMGGTILPMFTLAKMASGRDEIEEGALDFLMQILGGVLAYSFVWWQTTATGDMTWSGVAELGPIYSDRIAVCWIPNDDGLRTSRCKLGSLESLHGCVC